MHLEKKENGIWCVRVKVDGRWTRRSLRTKSKREARKRLGCLDLDSSKVETIRGTGTSRHNYFPRSARFLSFPRCFSPRPLRFLEISGTSARKASRRSGSNDDRSIDSSGSSSR